jgi:hypothetical protein
VLVLADTGVCWLYAALLGLYILHVLCLIRKWLLVRCMWAQLPGYCCCATEAIQLHVSNL